ncbi:trehalase-like domain-containing protein [Leifsonia sp. P73]|uniref:trehalase-like domain-containing protein n=1 Tax=Leifsonia sp. P73 TaxID=3423959 RepID=UPI003DA603B8
MEAFPDIADHGLIGDLQTVALVSTGGSIDWFCAPRFDSPTMFASLLDREKGGFFRIHALADDVRIRQMYFPQTAVLITRFMSSAGVGEVIDFMPVADEPRIATARRIIVRAVRVVRGELTFRLECRPRFDYGRSAHTATASDNGVLFADDTTSAALHGVPADALVDGDVDLEFALGAGDLRIFAFETEPRGEPATSGARAATACSARPSPSGGTGSAAAVTPAAGGRTSSARRWS